MHKWDVDDPAGITLESLGPVLAAADDIDVLLVGTGPGVVFLDRTIRDALRERRIVVEPTATGGAVRTYNILLGEQRAVAAALIAVESAR
jgi:uncharacterized protein